VALRRKNKGGISLVFGHLASWNVGPGRFGRPARPARPLSPGLSIRLSEPIWGRQPKRVSPATTYLGNELPALRLAKSYFNIIAAFSHKVSSLQPGCYSNTLLSKFWSLHLPLFRFILHRQAKQSDSRVTLRVPNLSLRSLPFIAKPKKAITEWRAGYLT